MGDFRFLHAADIHLDSPLHGLSRYDGVPVDEVRGATRAAFDNLIRYAIDEAVDFLVVAGDLFDGDWRDMGTGLYFARAMGKLDQAGIPAFVLTGNHDAASVLTRSLPWPPNVRLFSARRPQTHRLDDLGVAVHGQSFANAQVTENLALGYPAPVANLFNVGVLHTALGGHPQHARYAPCAPAELIAKGYDYWALGHVHDFAMVSERPPVVFPGNLQGRNIRETGPKGAVLVEVQDGAVAAVTLVPLDVVRWAQVEVDCSELTDIDALHAAIRARLSQAQAQDADGRPLVARVVLAGESALAGVLKDRQSQLRDEVRAIAAAVSPELWLEKLSIRVQLVAAAPGAIVEGADDILALLAGAADSPDLAQMLARDVAEFLAATPQPDAGDGDGLNFAARRGDWARLLRDGAAALQSRLTVADGG